MALKEAEASVRVHVPVNKAFSMWSDFERFPTFMENVRDVRKVDGNRYHWQTKVAGQRMDYDTEVVDITPNQRIAWRSVNGPHNEGEVVFQPKGDADTDVQVRLAYESPEGLAGQAESLLHLTRREVKEDLQNFKSLAEGRTRISATEKPRITRIGRPRWLSLFSSAGALLAGYAIGRLTNPNRIRITRLQATRGLPGELMAPQLTTTTYVSYGAGLGAIVASAILMARRRREAALFVGQWPALFFLLPIAIRLIIKRRALGPLRIVR